MAQINKPNLHFNTKLYTGNGSTQSITGVNFQPDLVWLKGRSVVAGHNLHDVVRGVNKQLYTNTTDAEETLTTLVTSFDSDGFSLGSNGNANSNTNTFVAWNWKAGGTAVSNTQGSITSSVSANTTSGFSIVSYTGNGSAGATVGHSLGTAPSFLVIFDRNTAGRGHFVYHKDLGANGYIFLNSTAAFVSGDTSMLNNTAPSSSLITLGDNACTNANTETYVAYCFAEKKGFSKFGSYTGNGSTDGTFVYTGFKPAMVIFKVTSTTGNWVMIDNARDTYNDCDASLYADLGIAEENPAAGVNGVDFLSNGFKIRDSKFFWNASGATYIYMAFAENPLVGTNNIPATAR